MLHGMLGLPLPFLAAEVASSLGRDLFFIVLAGFAAGLICQRLGVSMLIGYLVVGTLIGGEAFGLVATRTEAIEHIAELGVLLLLFTIGLEISLDDLVRLRRHLLVGGIVQMSAVILPFVGFYILIRAISGDAIDYRAAVLVGVAVSFSSTVLVFQALSELGEASTRHGRRAIGILLFQDVAVVPALLVIPLLTGNDASSTEDMVRLVVVSLLIIPVVAGLRMAVRWWVVPLLAELRSPALIVLFTVALLGGVVYAIVQAGLPAPLGAFAAGLILSGNRLTGQIDALILPFREVFSAVFFVSLGLLLDVTIVVTSPIDTLGGLVLILVLKTLAATVALRATRLAWRPAFGMGLGLSQIGEFALVIIMAGVASGVVTSDDYQRVLFLVMASLLLTPLMMQRGLRLTDHELDESEQQAKQGLMDMDRGHAVLAGMGLVGGGLARRLHVLRMDLCLIDLSPVNLHGFASAGFSTLAADATDPAVLRKAGLEEAKLLVITVPSDAVAIRVAQAARSVNRTCPILMRCRYRGTADEVRSLGVHTIIEEEQTLESILSQIDNLELND